MLSREENELLTRTGPGTACGALMRCYWQPAALSEELPPGGPPLPIRLLGEDLVLFRDDEGTPGLLGLHCAHRGADLSYGRLEDGGLRCIYHGWLYDIHGRCLEQPGEPAASTYHERIRQRAYPCREVGGLILTYMGPGQPPLVPNYECFTVPDDQRFVSKIFHRCNYLQGNEGNIDPVHLSFLHRRAGHSGTLAAPGPAPIVDAEETDFGVRVFGVRHVPPKLFVTVRNFVMPNLTATATAGFNWHVPIDDTHHWKYCVVFDTSRPLEADEVLRTRSEMATGYRLLRDPSNRYLQDREEMKALTFSGLGSSFQAQDACATEGEGSIQDRTSEHLTMRDKGIVTARLMLLRAIRDLQAGKDPPHVVRDPKANQFPDMVSLGEVFDESVDWRACWIERMRPVAEAASIKRLQEAPIPREA